LGYDPREEHPGRGVVEAIGIGMEFHDGDLAYRVNFATADGPEIVDRRVGRTSRRKSPIRSRPR
jgi:2,3-bisphosphoglycerate-independent phosphoglycerate mutase